MNPAATEPPTSDPLDPNPHTDAMASALGAILDRVPGSRAALPLLGALENSLRSKGLRALTTTSIDTVARVAAQLEALPVAGDDTPMHALHLHLLERIEAPTLVPHSSARSDFGPGDSLEVSEATMSDFHEARHEMSDFLAAQHALDPEPEPEVAAKPG